jgi:hypothetical protein
LQTIHRVGTHAAEPFVAGTSVMTAPPNVKNWNLNAIPGASARGCSAPVVLGPASSRQSRASKLYDHRSLRNRPSAPAPKAARKSCLSPCAACRYRGAGRAEVDTTGSSV